MYRYTLLPDVDNGTSTFWRRVFYSVVLTSVEFFLALVAILTGIPVFLDPIGLSLVPSSLAHLLPFWLVDLWGAQFAIGGLMTVWGIASGDFRNEQIGVLFLLSGAFIYSLALLTLLPGSWVAFITYVLFVLAMIARYWVLGKLIRLTRRLQKETKSIEE